MNYKNFIKTECGINKYEKLRKNRSFYGKIRFWIFIVFATLNDFNKKIQNMKALSIPAIVSWEIGILIFFFGLLLIFLGIRQSKKSFNIDKLPLTKSTTKLMFGTSLLLIGFVQTLTYFN